MAQGSLKTFDYYPFKAGKKLYNNATDTFKYAFITDAYSTVSKATVDPTLASFTEVSAGGNYSSGGNALPGNTWTIAAGVSKLDFTDISLSKAASSPTTAKTLLIINSTATNDCYHAIQLGAADGDAIDLVNNDLTVTFNAAGTVNITVTA
tara:strand:+ start:1526 stop:1978 length:453 start_codon:yes stop_codon:yes gene_type:complete